MMLKPWFIPYWDIVKELKVISNAVRTRSLFRSDQHGPSKDDRSALFQRTFVISCERRQLWQQFPVSVSLLYFPTVMTVITGFLEGIKLIIVLF